MLASNCTAFIRRYKFGAVLAIFREVGNRPNEGIAFNNLASVYQSQGQYDEALRSYEAALVITRETGNRVREGEIINNIGFVYQSQGRYKDALERYEISLAIVREQGDRAREGLILHNFATLYQFTDQYEDSLAYFDEALAISREAGDRANEGIILNSLAQTYISLSRYEDALERSEEALAIAREIGHRVNEGNALNTIGLIYQFQGQYEEALTNYETALIIVRDVGHRDGQGRILYNIGGIYHIQGKNLEAIAYYNQAITVFESMRTVSGSDAARARFIAQYAEVYQHTIDLYVQENLLSEAFLISEQGRARSFNDALTTGSVQLSENDAAPLLEGEQAAYQKQLTTQDALARARALNPPDPQLVEDLETQLTQAEAEYTATVTAITARKDQLDTLIPGRQAVLSLPEVQAYLNSQTTLVSFWVLEEKTITFVVTVHSINVVEIELSQDTLNTQIKAFHDFPEINTAHPATAVALYNSLIPPLLPYLHTPHLIIVPHQALHYVPFAALTDGEQYLLDRYAISYLPNASILQFLPDLARPVTYETVLALGNPADGGTDDFDQPLTNLANAERSAQQIAALFGATPLLGAEATEATLRQQVSAADILHIGAHGRFNIAAPLQSTIYLTPGDEQGDFANDGRLRVDEVFGLPMDNMELVVLSACQTNVGTPDRENPLRDITAGDELISLNRAFLFQSPSVISTLWIVDDTPTSLLMEHFYTYLLNGESKADALRLAQIDVRMEYPHPYNWAGFILSGDGGSTKVTTAKPQGDATGGDLPMPETVIAPSGNKTPLLIGSFLLVVFLMTAVFVGWRRWPRAGQPALTGQTVKPATAAQPVTETAVSSSLSTPAWVKSLSAKGIAQIKQGQIEDGTLILHECLQHNPNDAGSWLWLGVAAAKQDDLRAAHRCFLRAKQLEHPMAQDVPTSYAPSDLAKFVASLSSDREMK